MLEWLPFARPLPLTVNFAPRGMRNPIRGLVLHITTGHPTPGGLYSTWSHVDRHVSAHFSIARETGQIHQYVSLRDMAFAVGGDRLRNDDAYWYSIENEARAGEDMTREQLQSAARMLAWFNTNMDVPLQLADNREGAGLGYHSMFNRGDHVHCPGRRVIAQRAVIIEMAREILHGPSPELTRELNNL